MSVFQSWRRYKPDDEGASYGWLQWKGTDACLDFHCACGEHGHIDEMFCYYVKCGRCGQVYELSGYIEVRAVPADEDLSGQCDPILSSSCDDE